MYGEITKYRADLGVGVIDAENGRKHRFAKSEGVDFIFDVRRPRQIVVLSGSPWTAFGGVCAVAANDR